MVKYTKKGFDWYAYDKKHTKYSLPTTRQGIERYNAIKNEKFLFGIPAYTKRVVKHLGGFNKVASHVIPRHYQWPLAVGNAMYRAYYDAPSYVKPRLSWADQRRLESGAPAMSTALIKYGESPPPPRPKLRPNRPQYAGRWFVGRRQVKKIGMKRKRSFRKSDYAKKKYSKKY